MKFDENQFRARLNSVFKRNGFSSMLNLEGVNRFVELTELLLTENEKYNLTAIKEPNGIILNHYADSAALAAILPKGAKILDVGCGAGFPSLPIAILRPDVTVLAIDSTAKRIAYVNMVAEALGLTNITAEAARAEDLGRDADYREKFDCVTARAVATLRILSELCLPFAKVGGRFIAMKGKNAASELSESKKAIALLGGRIYATDDVRLSDGDEELIHPLIIIDKKQKTPAAYPRAFAQISKKPL